MKLSMSLSYKKFSREVENSIKLNRKVLLIFIIFNVVHERSQSLTFREQANLERIKIKKSNCTNLDLSAQLGPISDQMSAGWCAHNTAADLLSHKMKLFPNESVAVFDVAVKVFKREDEIGILENDVTPPLLKREGTEVFDSLKFYMEASGGACLERQLAPKKESIEDLRTESFVNFTYEGGWEGFNFKNYRFLPKVNPCTGKPDDLKRISEIVSALNQASLRKISDLNDSKCTNRVKIPNFKINEIKRGDELASPRKVVNTVNDILNSDNIVGYSYNACTIRKNNSESVKIIDDIEYCGVHASSIVGREWNDEKKICEYKIRNSWGKDCTTYVEKIAKTCTDGYFWVSEKMLLDNYHRLTWLE